MRKLQGINIIVHYPTTFYGVMSHIKHVVYANPDLVYDRIRKAKLTKEKKAALLELAREEAWEYARSDLLPYQLAATSHENQEDNHVP